MAEFYAYDLWEEYEYKHGDFIEVEEMLISNNLEDYVNLKFLHMINRGDIVNRLR